MAASSLAPGCLTRYAHTEDPVGFRTYGSLPVMGYWRSPEPRPGAVGVPTIGCRIVKVSREPSKRGGAMEPRRRGTGSASSAPVRRRSIQPTWDDRRSEQPRVGEE